MTKVGEWSETLTRPVRPSGQLRYATTLKGKALLLRTRSIGPGCWLVGGLLTSHAATHTWTGSGTSALWSDAANWQGNNRRESGESGAVRVFPPGTSRLSSSNDLTGLTVTQLASSGTNYVLNGDSALGLNSNLGSSIVAGGSSNRVALPLVLQTTNLFSVATNASLSLAGRLSGPGAFTLSDGGLLALAPAAGVDNSYLGTMALSQVHDEPSLVVPALVKSLGDTNANVRGVAVVGLKGIGWSGGARQAVPALELLLSDPDGQVRRAAVDALKQIDPEAAPKAGVK